MVLEILSHSSGWFGSWIQEGQEMGGGKEGGTRARNLTKGRHEIQRCRDTAVGEKKVATCPYIYKRFKCNVTRTHCNTNGPLAVEQGGGRAGAAAAHPALPPVLI